MKLAIGKDQAAVLETGEGLLIAIDIEEMADGGAMMWGLKFAAGPGEGGMHVLGKQAYDVFRTYADVLPMEKVAERTAAYVERHPAIPA